MTEKNLKDVFLEIAQRRDTNIHGLADILGCNNAALYRQIRTGSFTRISLKKMIEKLNLTDEEVLEIIHVKSDDELLKEFQKGKRTE